MATRPRGPRVADESEATASWLPSEAILRLVAMPVVTIERLIADGPFRVGDEYAFADEHSAALEGSVEHFTGTICEVAPIDDWRAKIKLELSDDEHERLLASRR